MRKLILQEHVTIDNFAADLNGGMDFQGEYSAKKMEIQDLRDLTKRGSNQ